MNENLNSPQELETSTELVAQPNLNTLNQNLDDSITEIVEKIVGEKDKDNLHDLTELFNQNQVKKNIIRTQQINSLMDLVTKEAYNRLSNSPHAFDNRELVEYMKALQQSLDRTQDSINKVPETPMIQINQQNNTIALGENREPILNSDSRGRIVDIIQAIINESSSETKEVEYTEEGDE